MTADSLLIETRSIDPRIVLPCYATTLDDGDKGRLEVAADDTPLWLAIVRLEADAATVNLRAPIVVDPRPMIGLQLLPAQSAYSCEHRLPLD